MNLTMSRSFGASLALAAVAVLVLGGCAKTGKTDEKGPMEKAGAAADKAVDNAVEKARTVSTEAGASLSEAADKTRTAAAVASSTAAAAIDKAADKAVAAVDKAADKTKEAAAGAAKATSTAVAPKK